jgi:hypothetical protein
MQRDNHYEAAIEAYLQRYRLGYVAVDESKRCSLDEEPIKNPDFIVYGREKTRFPIDVKGRRFPNGQGEKRRFVWQNWCGRDDIDALLRWESRMGADHRALLVFVYHLLPMVELPLGSPDLWFFRKRRYLVRAVEVREYAARMRTRSMKWNTVHLRSDDFRELVRPFRDFWTASPASPLLPVFETADSEPK